jgi:hypothetical protein
VSSGKKEGISGLKFNNVSETTNNTFSCKLINDEISLKPRSEKTTRVGL